MRQGASFRRAAPRERLQSLSNSVTIKTEALPRYGRRCFASGEFCRKAVMNMTLTEVCALLGLLGGAIAATFHICWVIFDHINKKK